MFALYEHLDLPIIFTKLCSTYGLRNNTFATVKTAYMIPYTQKHILMTPVITLGVDMKVNEVI